MQSDKREAEFMKDDEKLQYFSNKAHVPIKPYSNTFNLKVYQGAEILLYHYNELGRPRFDGILLVTDFRVSEKGMRVTVVDKPTYAIKKIGEIPTKVFDYDLIMHTPYTCYIERTVKRTAKNRVLTDVSSCISVRTKSHPMNKCPFHIQAMANSNTEKFFTRDEYLEAIQILEEGYEY